MKRILEISAMIALVTFSNSVQSQTLQQVWSVPRVGTFWSMQLTNQPPMPFLPDWLPQGTPVYLFTNGVYVYDDRSVDYEVVNAINQGTASATYPPSPWDGNYGSDTNTYPPNPKFTTNDLYLTIDLPPGSFYFDLALHNPATGKYYQWLATSDLRNRFGVPFWVPGEVVVTTTPSEAISFSQMSPTFPMRFFRAAGGDTSVSIRRTSGSPEAQEPCTSNGAPVATSFDITVNPPVNRSLTVVYLLSGSAENGVDYTNLSGSITLPPLTSLANLWVSPKYDTNWELEETVYINLVLTNGYLIDPIAPSASCVIKDCTTNLFTVVATNVPSPIEIDYHPPTKSLLLSANYDDNGLPNNFVRLDTNATVTRWSPVSNLYDEVKFAVIKNTTNGWTNGYMFFGSDTQIGFVSSNASTLSQTWTTLTNGIVANPLHLRGSICWDETGVWSNNLIAVCSEAGADNSTLKGVWRINATGRVDLVANLRTDHLEGVMTVPNEATKYGPFAGKVLTGDETILDENYKAAPVIYAIDTNGVTVPYALRIQPEDFDLVTTNDLYCVNYIPRGSGQPSRILKVSRAVLANFVGDILITQAGEYQDPFNPNNNELKPKLFFLHWDGSKFVIRSITLPDSFGGTFEHVTFAPIQLPDIP